MELIRPIPLEYELKRPRYDIRLRLEDEVYGRSVLIGVDSNESGILVKGSGIFRVGRNPRYPGFEFLSRTVSQLAKSLVFDIVNDSGEIIGHEDICFTVEVGGTYRQVDSL